MSLLYVVPLVCGVAFVAFVVGLRAGYRIASTTALRTVKHIFPGGVSKPDPPLVCAKCGAGNIAMMFVPIDGPATVECGGCGFKGKYEEVEP